MMILISCYVFVIGLVLGSFYNVVGLRLVKGESIISPPSHCPSCGGRLTLFDLVPVFSYLFLRGRCRSCGTKISWIYPVVECCSGLLFLAAFVHGSGTSFSQVLVGWLLISLLLIIFVSDVTDMIIPDKVLLVFLGLFTIFRFFYPMDPWWQAIAGFAAGFLLLVLIAIVSKGGMGGGDIKLFAVMGVLLGIKGIILAFLFSTFFGAVIGGIGLLSGKMKKKHPLPFGPFIVIGTLTAYFFGDAITVWYLSLLIQN